MEAPTVLVADDEPFVRSLLSRILEKNGWQVETAASHDEVLTRIENAPQDYRLLILDVEMPGPDVEVVIQTLRDRGYTGGVFLSSGMPAGERKQALEALSSGAFLTKPYDPQLLVRRVAPWKTTPGP